MKQVIENELSILTSLKSRFIIYYNNNSIQKLPSKSHTDTKNRLKYQKF